MQDARSSTGPRVLAFESQSEADTLAFGAALAATLPERAVIALDGTLGAGKTRLVQAVAAALGVDPRDVVSPTFVLVQEYHGRTAVFHFDAYRLKNEAEFWELGPQEYFSRRGLSLVEWADRVSGCLPAERLQIAIEITGETSRRFLISATGSDYDQIVDRLAAWADKRGMSTQRAAPQHPGVTLAEQATMRNNHEPLRDRS